jgi:hypothetical protein
MTSLLFIILTTSLASVAEKGKGVINGVVDKPKSVTAITAINRAEDTDKKYPGKIDPSTGKFSIPNLPLGATYDVIVDRGAKRLEGINLKVPASDYEEEMPLTKEDVKAIEKIARALNKFENEIDIMIVTGNCQHATVLLNKRRTTPFYGSKPGEMIWRLELWHFQKPEDDHWLKDPEELGVILYRERLQKAAFAKKCLTLDPALGGFKLTSKNPKIDVGKIDLPDDKAGVRLRPMKKVEKPADDK